MTLPTGSSRPGPGQAPNRTRSERWCLVLAAAWALLGAVGCGFLFIASTAPVSIPGDYPAMPAWMPSWLSSVVELAGLTAALPWLLIPIALLITGIIRLRRAVLTHWTYQAAWAAVIVAGIALEALIPRLSDIPRPAYQGPPIWAWGLAAEAAAFPAAGAVMITILTYAARHAHDRQAP